MLNCIRCDSKSFDSPEFKIKYGLHDWNFCERCYKDFWWWAVKSCKFCFKEVKGKNRGKLNKNLMICDECLKDR